MGKNSMMISQEIPDLPPEIIVYILSLLPVKTLIRFKCVSKSFLYLISNPQFVKSHLGISSNDPNLTHFRLILNSSDHLLQSFSLPFMLGCNPDNSLELDYPLKYPNCSVLVIGSVNGLMCIVINHKYIFIWNPLTRASKRLPDTGLEKLYKPYRTIYGFGFNERTDDYKVVGLFRLVGNEGSEELVVRIYSLKADSWRIISDFPSGYEWYEPVKSVNGSLHWVTILGFCLGDPSFIVSLDLSSEKFGEIPQPKYDRKPILFTLGVLKGCLCVLADNGDCSDLWVMKEYGVRDVLFHDNCYFSKMVFDIDNNKPCSMTMM